MARGKYGEELQAVEINSSSIIGVITDEGGMGSQIHATADGDITFIFPSGDKIVSATAGSDWVAGPGCTGITSTAEVILS